MVVPFFIFDATTGDPLAGLSPTFTTYKKRDADGNLTSLVQPPILDRGNGLYEFTTAPGDAARGTVIVYVIDCGASALTRYQDGTINGDEAVAAEESPSGTINVYDVDADSVRKAFFPNWTPFSSQSNPTATTVADYIDEEAADLAGALRVKSVDPTSIVDVNSEAFAWCAKTLKLMVAVRVYPAVTNGNPDGLKPLETQLENRFKWLDKHGLTLDGAGTLISGSGPEGPTSHISQYSLTTADQSRMSTTEPPFHKDDLL